MSESITIFFAVLILGFLMLVFSFERGMNSKKITNEQFVNATGICQQANTQLDYIQGDKVFCKNGLTKEQSND